MIDPVKVKFRAFKLYPGVHKGHADWKNFSKLGGAGGARLARPGPSTMNNPP
jgi:hypothetical protein